MDTKPSPLPIETPQQEVRTENEFDLGSPLTPMERTEEREAPTFADVQATLPHTSRQYTRCLRVNTSEETKALDGQLDTILGRLDEVKNQFDIMKGIRESQAEKMSKLKDNLYKLETLFNQIDQIESFIKIVHENVSEIESKVIQAEKELGNNILLKAFTTNPLNLLRGRSKQVETEEKPKWDPPRIIMTDQFFNSNVEAVNPHSI